MKKFWQTIREMLKPIPFNPIMEPEDLVCTHEGYSQCPVRQVNKELQDKLRQGLGHG